jgi:hypothetical protein
MRKFAAAAVLMLGLLALLGAGRGGTYTGGTYAGAGATYQAGGVAAELDTVKMVLTVDDAMDHFAASYDAAVAAADTVIGLGTDVPFAWDIIYRLRPNDDYSENLNIALSSRCNNFALTDSLANRYIGLFRVGFADIIPARSTILDAKVHFLNGANGFIAKEDTFMAVLMTQPGDTAWYRASTLGIPAQPSYQINYMGHASWRNQLAGTADGATAGRNYPTTSSDPWVPALNVRSYIWDWGSVWDWSKNFGEASQTAQVTDEETQMTIRNCVQAAVNGVTNNGIMWSVLDKTDTGLTNFYGWEQAAATNRLKRPWIEITYTTKKYREPLGAPFAVLFTTDDGFPTNAQYDSLFALINPDFNFTLGFESFAPNGVGKLTDTQIIALHDRGNEIATHGYNPPSYAGQPVPAGLTGPLILAGREGLNYYTQGGALVNYTRGAAHSMLALPGTTGYDSTCFQMDPAWLDSLAIAEGRTDLLNSQRWGRGFHVPNAGISLNAIRAASDVGLSWVRTLPASTKANATSGYYERTRAASTLSGAPGYALADSLFCGVPYAQQTARPYNLRCFPTTMDLNVIFGATTANYTEDQVKHYMRRALAGIRGDGTNVLCVTTHHQKTAAQDGLDLDEARWMAEVIDAWGGRMLTVNEWITAMRASATPAATPAGWGQEDPYNWAAGDEQIYRLSGTHYK